MIRFRVSVEKQEKRKGKNSPCLYGDVLFGEAEMSLDISAGELSRVPRHPVPPQARQNKVRYRIGCLLIWESPREQGAERDS